MIAGRRKISKLEERSVEIIQSKEQRKKIIKKNYQRFRDSGIAVSIPTYVWESHKRREREKGRMNI